MNRDLVALYSDYLLSSFGATTATGLSGLLEGSISHDQITRFLSQEDFDSKTLWQLVKPMARDIEDDDGVLIFDDTIQEKPYADENELISWHFGHSKNRAVKGINPGSSPGQALRRMLSVCQRNQVTYRYVLADSWFSAKENLHFIHQGLGKHFVIVLKSNHTVA